MEKEQLSQIERELFKIISGREYEEALKFDNSNFEENNGIVASESPIAKAAAALCQSKMVDLVGWLTRQDSKTLRLKTDLLVKKYLTEQKETRQ